MSYWSTKLDFLCGPCAADALDAAISCLQASAASWVQVPAAQRAAMLQDCLVRLPALARQAAMAAAQVKGSYGAGHGEEM